MTTTTTLFKKTPSSHKRQKVISVVMSPDLIAEIDRIRGDHISRSVFLRIAAVEKMQREQKK
jgi:hypothetical protein